MQGCRDMQNIKSAVTTVSGKGCAQSLSLDQDGR